MRNFLLFTLISLAFLSCENEFRKKSEMQVLHWSVHQRKKNMIYEKQDTLPLKRDFIELKEIGQLKISIIDTILSKKIENQEYKLDSLIVWVKPLAEKIYKDEKIELYNIFISDIKNGGEINFVYSKKYGVLMQILDSFNILALKKVIEFDRHIRIKRELTFGELQEELLRDTVLFPQIKIPPLPSQK